MPAPPGGGLSDLPAPGRAGKPTDLEADITMRMNRRRFLTASAVAAGAVAVGGGAYLALFRDADPLDDFYQGTEKVLAARFGPDRAGPLMEKIRKEYKALTPAVPHIGGEDNIFTEWLTYGVYCVAVYRVLRPLFPSVEGVGRVIYETYEAMADHPKWLLRLVGRFRYGKGYVRTLERAALLSQERRYPGDWVCAFVRGDGVGFDYGLDFSECGICKFTHAQGADEVTPYICLADEVVSRAFDRGLVRYRTIAEGGGGCDFRYKTGRKTFVYPLRHGWPPRFAPETGKP